MESSPFLDDFTVYGELGLFQRGYGVLVYTSMRSYY